MPTGVFSVSFSLRMSPWISSLTLGAHDDDWDVWAVSTELAVELVELLETGLILQTEDQDHRINPAAELEKQTDEVGGC